MFHHQLYVTMINVMWMMQGAIFNQATHTVEHHLPSAAAEYPRMSQPFCDC
jgi:hypothetical protein